MRFCQSDSFLHLASGEFDVGATPCSFLHRAICIEKIAVGFSPCKVPKPQPRLSSHGMRDQAEFGRFGIYQLLQAHQRTPILVQL